MAGNGKGKLEDLENSENVEDYESIKAEINKNDIAGIYSQPDSTDNTRLLMVPGDDLIALLMRSDICSNRFALGVCMSIQRCKKHKYRDGQNFYNLLLASRPGVRGKRAELYSDTIIGEKTHYTKEGMFQKIKKFAIGGNAE